MRHVLGALGAATFSALLLVSPATHAQPVLKLAKEAITLGEADGVELTVGGGVRQGDLVVVRDDAARSGSLFVAVEAGTLEEVEETAGVEAPAPGATIKFRWRVPRDLIPRRLAAVAIDTDTHEATLALLAVSRRAKIKVAASPNAQVRLATAARYSLAGRLTLRVP